MEHSFASRSSSRDGFLKSFVDLFALAMSDTALLTNWSLFGRAAAEIGMGDDEDSRAYMNDSKCGRPGHVQCIEPAMPAICKHRHRDDL